MKIICDTCIYAAGSKCKKFLVPEITTKYMYHTRIFKVFGWTICVKRAQKEIGLHK